MSTKMQVQWRRATVLELSSQSYTQIEIAAQLQVDEPTIRRDMAFLRLEAQENLQKHIHETVPEEYQKCMVGMKRNLKQTLEIRDNPSDPKVKLQAVAIVQRLLQIHTGYVNQCTQKTETLQKLRRKFRRERDRGRNYYKPHILVK